FIIQDEIPHVADAFIDDIAIKGPKSFYKDEKGNFETIPGNPGIRRFIWEHVNDVHRILHKFKCAGATFSPKKTQIAVPQALILGQNCSIHGRTPDSDKIAKLLNWPRPMTVRQMRGFLGLCG
ncbi:hypothetical protein BD410DRAFT_702196, partial [Rickenella mellea]